MADPLAYLNVLIKSDNPGFLNAIYNMAPHRNDSRLWDSDQYKLESGVDHEGDTYVAMSLFFLDFNERTSFRSSLSSINGFIHTALPGSHVILSKCWHHDLLTNGTPVKSDELEYQEIVV